MTVTRRLGGYTLNDETTDLAPINAKQRAAIVALLTTGDVSKAAQAAGVSRESLYRWLRDPRFKAELRQAEGDAMRGLARRLAGLGDLAADAMKDALDPGQPIGIRLRAADLVLTRGPALFELVNLVDRLERLEARL